MIPLLFYLLCALPLFAEDSGSLMHAEALFAEGHYQDALHYYEEIPEPFAQVRLAECYLELGEAAKVITALQRLDATSNVQVAYLTARAYRQLGDYQQALEILKPHTGVVRDDINLERGINYYLLNDFLKARAYFDSIAKDESNSTAYLLAQLYLARLAIIENRPTLANELLTAATIQEKHPLYGEKATLLGMVQFQQHRYREAIASFDLALSKQGAVPSAWAPDALLYKGRSFVMLAEEPGVSRSEQESLYSQAEAAFLLLLRNSAHGQAVTVKISSPLQKESATLALAAFYIAKGRRLQDEGAFTAARKLVAQNESFTSKEGQIEALMLQAEATASYPERDALYRKLVLIYPAGWILKGYNDLEEGATNAANAKQALGEAVRSYQRGYEALKDGDPAQAGLCLKQQAHAYALLQDPVKACKVLDQLINAEALLSQMTDPDELYYIYGRTAKSLPAALDPQGLIEKTLKAGIDRYPNGKWTDAMLYSLGVLYIEKKEWAEAERTFAALTVRYPLSPFASEAFFGRAQCAEELQQGHAVAQGYLQHIFTHYPHSSKAAQAYLSYYSSRDYLQGERKAIKHLTAMPQLFSESPLIITAYYLIGLDNKKDHRSLEGKVLRRQNLMGAIEAFHQAEATYEKLLAKQAIPVEELSYYTRLKQKAAFERARANLAIAMESKAAKREITLSYAETAFKDSIKELLKSGANQDLLEENEFWLAQTYLKVDNDSAAETQFNKVIEEHGKLVARAWYEKGLIHFRRQNYQQALEAFSSAEKLAAESKGLLSEEQLLEVWIQQGLSYQQLGKSDEAMKLFSKVVNAEVISGLRLKAMFLRAELYEQQGRHELARKQLDAVVKKGGKWAEHAQHKLEQNYGYQ